jgi:uncharacterized membrane protein YesL
MGSFLVLPAVLLMSVIPGVIFVLLTAVPSLAGVVYAMDNKVKRKQFRYTLFFKGFKKFYFKALVLGFLIALLILIPVSSFWYYAKVKTTLNLIVAMFQLYLCLTVFIALTYTLPLIISGQNTLLGSIKMSFKLFMDNMAYTFGSFVQIAAVSVLMIITVISMPMLFGGMFSIFSINLYENLLLKYTEEDKKRS